MNRSHLEAIYDSCFLDSSSAVVTTDKKLFLFENLETQIERILALDGVDGPDEYPEPPSKHQQLKHFRDCRYQPVHGKNNLIVHGCKNDIRLYDRRMPLKSFSTIKLSDKSIPTSIHLDEQYVTCSLIPWNQKRKNNQQSVLSLFDIRSHLSMDGADKLTTGNINSKAIRSSPIKNSHYSCLKISVANGMIAFPSQCGTIRLFEAKTLKEHIQNYIKYPLHDFESSPVLREPGKPAFTPICYLTDYNLFYSRLNNGTPEIVKCGL